VTLDDVERERADPKGLASRPDERPVGRLSLWLLTRLRAHAGHVGAVMMTVAALIGVVALVVIIRYGVWI